MTAGEALAMVARLDGSIGIVETSEGERLRISPDTVLTSDLRATLRSEKPKVLALLRLLHKASLEQYARDVIELEDEPTVEELIAEVEQLGAKLYLRRQGDVGIWNGDRIPDEFLLRLTRAHVRLLAQLERKEQVALGGLRTEAG